MDNPAEPKLAEAMNRLWERFLPQLEERVAALEAWAEALASGALHAEQREEAHSTAHKLAGVLGTFGLTEGTQLAREAEAFYGGNGSSNPTEVERMAEIASRLRAMLAEKRS